jgi:pyruvyltransferase
LLYPRYYRPHVEETSPGLGLVPHFRDAHHPTIARLAQGPGVKVINVKDPVPTVVDQIAGCKVIASTSLHGLIVAAAYGVPALWIDVSDRVRGKGFKFRDFFQSIRSPVRAPFRPGPRTEGAELANRATVHRLDIDLDALLDACPFNPSRR